MTLQELIDDGRRAFFSGDHVKYLKVLHRVAAYICETTSFGNFNEALAVESVWYNNLVKLVESEDNYAVSFSQHTSSLWRAGRRFWEALPNRSETRVCFIVPTGVLLGHTEVMLQIIRGWRRNGLKVTPIVVSLSGFDGKLDRELRSLGVEVFSPPADVRGVVAVAQWARSVINAAQCNTAIWVSVPVMVSFFFGFGLAPRQVLWSLKFHPVHLGETVVHIGMTPPGKGEVLINGHPWKRFSPPLSLPFSEVPREDVSALRNRLGGAFIFGSIARTEKFNSRTFVDSVVEIVARCPGSIFVYTGRDESPVVKEAFGRAGLSDSVRFVGWVDTNLYAQTLDVFLETFPFGCGVTGAQAVNAGTRTVSLWCPETLPGYYFERLDEARAACGHWRVETEISDYRQRALDFFKEGRKEFESVHTGVLFKLDDSKAVRFHDLLFEVA